MIDHFGLLAPLYDRFIGPPDLEQLKGLLELPREGALLDAGGGTGRVSAQLRHLVNEVVITDESFSMLQQAQQKMHCCAAVGAVERLPYATAAFEIVLVVDALHHFADHRRAVAELVRVLKPGGRLVIEEPDLNRLSVKFVALAERLALMRSHFYYPNEIGRMIANQGLAPRIIGDDRFSVWIVADKASRDP